MLSKVRTSLYLAVALLVAVMFTSVSRGSSIHSDSLIRGLQSKSVAMTTILQSEQTAAPVLKEGDKKEGDKKEDERKKGDERKKSDEKVGDKKKEGKDEKKAEPKAEKVEKAEKAEAEADAEAEAEAMRSDQELRNKKPADLTTEELTRELTRVKDSINGDRVLPEVERWNNDHDLHRDNPLWDTPLDNEAKTRQDEAPMPKGYKGKMTTKYAAYEQVRVCKEKYGGAKEKVDGATFFTLVRNSELYDIIRSIQEMESRFNRWYHYDWVFVNDEPFTEKFIQVTSSLVSGTARYGIIPKEHWSYPEWIDQDRAEEVRTSRKFSSVVYGDSESYRFMCRYNSRFFYKHPIMEEYEYYWRVEPAVNFMCDILEDPFRYLKETGSTYGFTIAFPELLKTVETLWGTSMEYFNKAEVRKKLPPPENSLRQFVTDDEGKTYNMCHFWSNFEVASLALWRSELYENYVDYLDHAGGFFYERWGDAPVHSIAVAMIEEKQKVHVFDDISYRHTVAGTCPLDDDLWTRAHCVCEQLGDWTLTGREKCNEKFYAASGQEHRRDYDKYKRILDEREKTVEEDRLRRKALRAEAAKRRAAERRRRNQERRRKQEERRKKLVEAAEAKGKAAAAAAAAAAKPNNG